MARKPSRRESVLVVFVALLGIALLYSGRGWKIEVSAERAEAGSLPDAEAPRVGRRVPPTPGFTYLGYLGPKHQRIAVFERNGELFLARPGELIARRFRLVEFDFDSVVLGYVDEEWKHHTTALAMRAAGRG